MCNDEWRRPLKCHGILRQASKREIFLSAHFVGADEHSHEGHEECKCTKMCFRVRLSFDLRCDVLGTRWTFYPDRIWTNFGRVSSDESSLSWRWWEINKRQINIFMTSLVTFNFRRCFLSQKRRFTYFSFFFYCARALTFNEIPIWRSLTDTLTTIFLWIHETVHGSSICVFSLFFNKKILYFIETF